MPALPVAIANYVYADMNSPSARANHACAIVGEATLATYCWGDNSYGQLGDGTTSNRSVPTRVVGQLESGS